MRVESEGRGVVVNQEVVEAEPALAFEPPSALETPMDPASAYRCREEAGPSIGRPRAEDDPVGKARVELKETLTWLLSGGMLSDVLVEVALEAFKPFVDLASDEALREALDRLRTASTGEEALGALDRVLYALAGHEMTQAGASQALRVFTAARTALAFLRADLPQTGRELGPRMQAAVTEGIQLAHQIVRGVGDEAGLVRLEGEIESIAAELQKRIDREVPTARLVTAVERAYRLGVGARSGASIARALRATTNLELSSEERAAVYRSVDPLGDKLTDTVAGVFVAGARSRHRPRVAPLGPLVDQAMHVGDEHLAGSPYAFLSEIDYAAVLAYLDDFVDRVQTPEGFDRLNRALNVIRQIGRVESEVTARIALSVPPSALSSLLGALVESTLGMLRVSGTLIQQNLSGMDTTALLEVLLADPEDAEEALGADARAGRLLGERLWAREPEGTKEIGDEVRAIGRRLKEAVARIETTEEGREALQEIGVDLKETGKVLLGMAQFFGALANPEMDRIARKEAIKAAIDTMGLAKLFQTLVNLLPLLPGVETLRDMVPDWGAMVEACLELQDRNPAMPWPKAEAQLIESLGAHPRELFERFEEEPFAAGTIGQVHRATMRDPQTGESIPVVVKIQRPDVAENIERTARTARLGMLLLRELLMLDDQGEVFGNLQSFARSFLPMLERAHGPFIDALRIETSPEIEKENLRRHSELLAPHGKIATPELIESRSAGTVITMTDTSGSRLDTWLARYEHARDAEGLASQLGSLPRRGAAEEATVRATRWIHERFGLVPDDVHVTKKAMGHLELSAHAAGLSAPIHLRIDRRSGEVSALSDPPPIDEANVATLAVRWAEKAHGLPVSSSRIARREDGSTTVEVTLSKLVIRGDRVEVEEGKGPVVSVKVDRRGGVRSDEMVPDLTDAAIRNLEEQLFVGFVVPAFGGALHGDPHMGNFLVQRDGRYIVPLDYGLVLPLEMEEVLLPLRLVARGAFERRDEVAALAAELFTIPEHLDAEAKLEAWARTYDEALKEEKAKGGAMTDRLIGRPGLRALGRLFEVIFNDPELAPKSSWLHSAKSLLSFSGDMRAFDRARQDSVSPWRLGAWALRAVAFNRAFGRLRGTRVRRQKAERLRALARVL